MKYLETLKRRVPWTYIISPTSYRALMGNLNRVHDRVFFEHGPHMAAWRAVRLATWTNPFPWSSFDDEGGLQ